VSWDLFYSYCILNDICNASNLCNFILFADDTNIFVMGDSKKEAYEKSKLVLKSVHNYMTCNKLHINVKNCCYMYFNPANKNKDSSVDTNPDLNLTLNSIVIEKLTKTKFLGVIIDDKLSWVPHIEGLSTMLK